MTTSEAHLFWQTAHRLSGLALVIFLGFAALTGSALCFKRELDKSLNTDLFYQHPVSSPPPTPQVVDNFRKAHPEWQVLSFPLNLAADERIPVRVEPSTPINEATANQLFLDRTTGVVKGSRLSDPALDRRGAIELLRSAHYTLMLEPYGRWFMGVIGAIWFISNFIGFYLTLPRQGTFWRGWKRTWRFSHKSSFPRLMLDVHRSFGLWMILPLTLLATTAVALNFFGEYYIPLVDKIAPEARQPLPTAPPQSPRPLDAASAVVSARHVAAQLPGTFYPAGIEFRAAEDQIGVALTVDGTLSYRHLGPIYVYFDTRSGKVAEVMDPYHGNDNLAARRILYPLHSGRVFGWPTTALIFVCGLTTLGLCVTGAYLWWKRRPMRRRPLRR